MEWPATSQSVVTELHGGVPADHHPVLRTPMVILQRQVLPRVDGEPFDLTFGAVEQILEHAPRPVFETVFGRRSIPMLFK